MAPSPYLVASLARLRDEFNRMAPDRDKASDGWIGDAAHSANVSDHNPASDGGVHAIDVDEDLRLPGVSMEYCVQFLLAECRAGRERRLKYIIYERRIWSASGDWRQQPYTGKNAHDKHAHFSGKYGAVERDASSYGLEDEFMAVDYDKIRTIVREEVDKRLDALKVPTAEENGKAALTAFRQSPTTGMSDTGRNLISAEITEAVKAGVAIERYPANEGKK